MKFFDVVTQVVELLQSSKRVSYRALKREFDLDDEMLDDLKEELVVARRVARDEDGRVLAWNAPGANAPRPPAATCREYRRCRRGSCARG